MKSSASLDVDQKILCDSGDWELNAVMNNRDRRVVTAIGSLFPKKTEPPIPFLLMISDHDGRGGID
jgi:hypothetical protein